MRIDGTIARGPTTTSSAAKRTTLTDWIFIISLSPSSNYCGGSRGCGMLWLLACLPVCLSAWVHRGSLEAAVCYQWVPEKRPASLAKNRVRTLRAGPVVSPCRLYACYQLDLVSVSIPYKKNPVFAWYRAVPQKRQLSRLKGCRDSGVATQYTNGPVKMEKDSFRWRGCLYRWG